MLTGQMLKDAAMSTVAIREARSLTGEILTLVTAAIGKHDFPNTDCNGERRSLRTEAGLLTYSKPRGGNVWLACGASRRDPSVHKREPHAHIDEFVYLDKGWLLNWCAGGGSGESIRNVGQLPLGVLPDLIFEDLAVCLGPLVIEIPMLESNLTRLANFGKKK